MRIYCEKCKSIFEAEKPAEGAQVNCPKCNEPIDFPETSTSPGAVIGDFLIEQPLSKGGMGEVFLARQLSLDRPVALKVLQDKFINDKEYVDSLFHEARAAGRISHPNIVQAYAVGEENGTYYFAMEFVRGETFKQILKREKKLDFMVAAKVIREIAGALDAAWREQMLVHQDIKPDNIMLDANGFAKLADLGLARVAGNEQHDDEIGDEVMGTPQYISPEQLTGVPTDVRSDIYSLGATFYQFVTGRFPYTADSALDIAKMHVAGNLTPPKKLNPELPEELNTIIMKMMARDREQRYQTPAPLMKALDLFMSNYRPSAVPKMNLNFGRKAAAPVFSLPKAAAKPAPVFTPPVADSKPEPLPVPEVTAGALPAELTSGKEVAIGEVKSDGEVTGVPAPESKSSVDEKTAETAPVAPPEPEKEMPRPEFAAPEPEVAEAPPAKVSFCGKWFRRLRLPVGIALGVILLAGALLGGAYWFVKSGKLPESWKPYGEKLLAWLPAEGSQPAAVPPEAPPEQPVKTPPKPPVPVKPPEPPRIVTRAAYLKGVEEILLQVRNNPDDREGLLARGDRFFIAYPEARTDEERNAAVPLLLVYGRVDELLRAAPARAAARERHLAKIAERERADASAAEARREREEEEKKRRETAEQAARDQAIREKEQIEAARRLVAERSAKLKEELEPEMVAVGRAFLKGVATGNTEAMETARTAAEAVQIPPECDSAGEKQLISRYRQFLAKLPAEAAKVEKIRKAMEAINAQSSFSVQISNNRLAEIVAVRPGAIRALSDNGDVEFHLNDPKEPNRAAHFFQRLNRRLKQQNMDFYYQLLSGDLTPELAAKAPKGFWSDYFEIFRRAAE